MDYLIAIIFGVVQGISEFLPISSSGHLIILHRFFSLPIGNELAFDVFLHLATLLAVTISFYREIWLLISSFVRSLFGKEDEYSRTAWYIALASIPAALAGFGLGDIIDEQFHGGNTQEIVVVVTMLIAVALLFIWIEKRPQGSKSFSGLSMKEAFSVGLAQALALVPGTSRSGITIIAGLLCGLKREEALRFSFLLSIPVILGASVSEAPDLFHSSLSAHELNVIIAAFLSSLITGVLCIKFFLKFARTNNLVPFAYYRIALAVLLILFLVM